VGKWWLIACAGLGCNAIFEENPGFTPDSDGSTLTEGATAISGSSDEAPAQCDGVDMYEPNDSTNALALLDPVDSQATVAIAAELGGATDEDWFKQSVEQAGAAPMQPTIEVSAAEAVRACLYVGCSAGTTTIDCGSATPHTSDSNTDGCCDDDRVSFTYTCEGAVDLDASTYLRITTAGPSETCIPYDLTYRFVP
jgi:hypothetical protein